MKYLPILCVAFMAFTQRTAAQTYYCDSVKEYQYLQETMNWSCIMNKKMDYTYAFNKDRSIIYVVHTDQPNYPFKVKNLTTDENNVIYFTAVDETKRLSYKIKIGANYLSLQDDQYSYFLHIKSVK